MYFLKYPLDLKNELCRVAGYRSNKQKSILFLYTGTEESEIEIKMKQ